jgi:hypothetical protein
MRARIINELNEEWMSLLSLDGTAIPEFMTHIYKISPEWEMIMNKNSILLSSKWAVIYNADYNPDRPLHIYHIKCAVSRGVPLDIKWVKCPRCKHKLDIYLLYKAKIYAKACKIANFNVNI